MNPTPTTQRHVKFDDLIWMDHTISRNFNAESRTRMDTISGDIQRDWAMNTKVHPKPFVTRIVRGEDGKFHLERKVSLSTEPWERTDKAFSSDFLYKMLFALYEGKITLEKFIEVHPMHSNRNGRNAPDKLRKLIARGKYAKA